MIAQGSRACSASPWLPPWGGSQRGDAVPAGRNEVPPLDGRSADPRTRRSDFRI